MNLADAEHLTSSISPGRAANSAALGFHVISTDGFERDPPRAAASALAACFRRCERLSSCAAALDVISASLAAFFSAVSRPVE